MGQCAGLKQKLVIVSAALREIYVSARDIPYRKRRLQSWVPIYRLLHRELAQLVCKDNGAKFVEVARVQLRDELRIVVVNSSFGNTILPLFPVVRVEFP